MIVFGVSSGEYSYYRVHAMFATRELAEEYVVAHNATESYGTAGVEEYELFDRLPQRVTWWERQLTLHDDGSWPPRPQDLEPYEQVAWEYDAPRGLTRRADVEVRYSQPYRSGLTSGSDEEGAMRPGTYTVEIRSLDRDAVAKTTSEYVARWKAQGFQLHNAKPWV